MRQRCGGQILIGASIGGVLPTLAATVVHAAAGHAEAHHVPSVYDLLLPLVNFVLFVWLLRWAGAGAFREYFRRRRADVIGLLDTAARAKAEAERLHAETRARLAQVDADAERLRADMRTMATRERQRRLELVRNAAARLTADARFIGEQEVRAAHSALRRETAAAALAEAVALLQRQIGTGDHERFLREFLGGMRGAT
jgi:F0F1-type ATP synthase membrane subunit b/b'